MNRFIRWRRAIGRFLPFLRSIGAVCASFLIIVPSRVIYIVVLQEMIWKWWLGYGERPGRVLTAIAVILLVTWLLYWQVGTFVVETPNGIPRTGPPSPQDALYYSLVSFSALGYGNWAPQPTGWAQWVGAVQPFFGIISAVALSINLTQRISH